MNFDANLTMPKKGYLFQLFPSYVPGCLKTHCALLSGSLATSGGKKWINETKV